MKLAIEIDTMRVQEIGDFATFCKSIAGSKHNGQHYQAPGWILAEINVSVGGANFGLMHPDTLGETGHMDVRAIYNSADAPPTFHRYSQTQKFTPREKDGMQDTIWPTGGWSLLQTVLAIEKFLEDKMGFRPTLREALFTSLESQSQPVPA